MRVFGHTRTRAFWCSALCTKDRYMSFWNRSSCLIRELVAMGRDGPSRMEVDDDTTCDDNDAFLRLPPASDLRVNLSDIIGSILSAFGVR